MVTRYVIVVQDDPASFNLRPELSFYPQFMFNLRRSQFVQVFGNSPDETACDTNHEDQNTESLRPIISIPSLTRLSFSLTRFTNGICPASIAQSVRPCVRACAQPLRTQWLLLRHGAAASPHLQRRDEGEAEVEYLPQRAGRPRYLTWDVCTLSGRSSAWMRG